MVKSALADAVQMKTLPVDEFLAQAAENPLALVRLAAAFFNMGEKARACEIALQALAMAPDDARIRSLAGTVLSQDVPRWHFGIVQDGMRNAAYDAALGRAVTARTRVLEIGTGTGILAMMAARAGAGHVATCEMVPAIAAVAREIIERNGFGDRVRVVAKKSLDVDAEADLGGRADVLVSEIVDNKLIGEGILPIIEHAAALLLKPGAKIIPARGFVRVALAHDRAIHRARMGVIDGFDLSPFNQLARDAYVPGGASTSVILLSQPTDLFSFDFQTGGPFPAATASTTVISTGGCANGIAQWIALQMDESGRYENDPRSGKPSAWSPVFWPLISAREYPAGVSVNICGSHDRHRLRIWV